MIFFLIPDFGDKYNDLINLYDGHLQQVLLHQLVPKDRNFSMIPITILYLNKYFFKYNSQLKK